jgi:hypothetical protein
MARSWRLYVLAGMAAAALGLAANAQGQVPAASANEGTTASKPDTPESIFNGQVRRYSFALEGMFVTADTAEEFVVQYQGRNKERPPIVGAYADGERDALVVVAKPEAEQAIRESLAEWIVARRGFGAPSLKAQRREIEARWRVLVIGMAECEVKLVELTGDRGQKMRDRLRLIEEELTTLERQLQVMDQYIARLAAGPNADQ